MQIIYCHHALRDRKQNPDQQDGLLPLGVQDAQIVAKLFELANKKGRVKAIYTSQFFRCTETAKIVNEHINAPVFIEPRFDEFQSIDGETWVDLQRRVQNAILDIVRKYDEDDIVICVTSGVNVVGFISLAYGLEPDEKAPFIGIPSCSPMVFEIKDKRK